MGWPFLLSVPRFQSGLCRPELSGRTFTQRTSTLFRMGLQLAGPFLVVTVRSWRAVSKLTTWLTLMGENCGVRLASRRGRAKLGQDHPDTISSVNNLAGLLYAQGPVDVGLLGKGFLMCYCCLVRHLRFSLEGALGVWQTRPPTPP